MGDWAENKIVVVCGPTATGKTELAARLCQRFAGEMIGADSMQIYKGLPIGTAAPQLGEYPGISRHLIGFLSPEYSFSVAEYTKAAGRVIEEVQSRRALPVLCGGTGLYIQSLVNGICFTEEKADSGLQERLEEEWEKQGPDAMRRHLRRLDPEHAERLADGDKRRILRSLELFEMTGKTYAQRARESQPDAPPYDALCVGLACADRQELYQRINKRTDTMMEQGLLLEAETVFRNKEKYRGVVQAIGYKEFFPYFEGTMSLADCVEKLKQATRRYAKRQMTWFRRMPQVRWVQAGTAETTRQAEGLVREFLE